MKRTFAILAGVALLALVPSFAAADTIIGTEGNDGFIGDVLAGFPGQVIAASDGEVPFHPFDAPFDCTDGLQLNIAGFTFTLDPSSGNWALLSPQTWVLPAINENEPISEDVGHWTVDQPGAFWVPGVPGRYIILSADGAVSDVITLANDGPGGVATITFASDPIVPEPASLTLLTVGLAGVAAARLRRRKMA